MPHAASMRRLRRNELAPWFPFLVRLCSIRQTTGGSASYVNLRRLEARSSARRHKGHEPSHLESRASFQVCKQRLWVPSQFVYVRTYGHGRYARTCAHTYVCLFVCPSVCMYVYAYTYMREKHDLLWAMWSPGICSGAQKTLARPLCELAAVSKNRGGTSEISCF